MTVARLLIIVIGALVVYRALGRAALARGHRQVGDFIGWTVVTVVAALVVIAAVVSWLG